MLAVAKGTECEGSSVAVEGAVVLAPDCEVLLSNFMIGVPRIDGCLRRTEIGTFSLTAGRFTVRPRTFHTGLDLRAVVDVCLRISTSLFAVDGVVAEESSLEPGESLRTM